jgi:hypothetical protein
MNINMSFTIKGNNFKFTSLINYCITTFDDNSSIIVEMDETGNIRFPSKYIDKNGTSVSLWTWYDIFNCNHRPIVGGNGFNDFVPDNF